MIEPPKAANLDGLVELGNRTGVDIRPTLLRVVTDLYIQKPTHSEAEERQFTVLALRLIELVDAPTRSIVAEKIAGYPAAPTAVRQRHRAECCKARSVRRPMRRTEPTYKSTEEAHAVRFAGKCSSRYARSALVLVRTYWSQSILGRSAISTRSRGPAGE